MASRRSILSSILGISMVALLLGAGCQRQSSTTAPGSEPGQEQAQQNAAPAPAPPVSDAAPNELGRVPVLEYHVIGPKEGRWARTPEAFRKDLETLYAHGFRAVSLRDYVTGHINLPRGASPVVFTFDDATEGQFRYLEKDGKLVIDPDCAVGILEEFSRKHPDFGFEATFYVLPESAFGQPQYRKQKLQYLAEKGLEIGNHTWSHHALKRLSNEKVQEELARPQQAIGEVVPNFRFFSLALPLGISPKEKSLASKGAWNGITYEHQAVLLVGSVPAPSPYDKDFNPRAIQRVQATDWPEVKPFQLSAQIKTLVETENRRYVSDGDPNTIAVPAALKDDLAPDKTQGKEVKIY
ncbi:MAG TPA: polysaccharide deacetylase family protein [Armatimonadetes bacterium]|jgi:peptidoglycan/xylan/chitin deacetylase (PgdA/CDA1 family)|nr:polysaccharide deacetylase family protein [Armatimonadota bacterium]